MVVKQILSSIEFGVCGRDTEDVFPYCDRCYGGEFQRKVRTSRV
jgi:hypothetical protein